MVDLIPEGFISLRAAYKMLACGLWGADPPHTTTRHEQIYVNAGSPIARRSRRKQENIQAQLFAELVSAFAAGDLEALVRAPGSLENYSMPPDSWASAS